MAAAAVTGKSNTGGMNLWQLYALLKTLKTEEEREPVVKAIGEREVMLRDNRDHGVKTDDDKLDTVRLAQAVFDKTTARVGCNGWPDYSVATRVPESDYREFSGLRNDKAYAELCGKKLVVLFVPAADRAWIMTATLEQLTEVCDLKWDQKTAHNEWRRSSDLYVITKLK
jgi:hypothetical protein